ncbi:MAG TPA: stage II sporulation protein M, partial [Thermoanaerobaculia bacterium]
MYTFRLKSTQFRRERERAWRELEELLAKVEKEGVGRLSAPELSRLPTLYRSAVSSLSVAQTISLDKNLLDYLTALAGRAYVVVYGTQRQAGAALADLVRRELPRTVRRHALFVALALAILGAGVLTGFRLTRADPETYYSFVPAEMSEGRTPAASTAELRRVLYAEQQGLGLFATFLFTHNAKIGILCFALGVAAGAPVPFLLFWNGLSLGALAALYHARGLGLEFWAWVLPHGVTELTAVCLCG